MAKKPKTKSQSKPTGWRALPYRVLRAILDWYLGYWRRSWFHKFFICLVILICVTIAGMYSIARWYMWTQSSKPLMLGATFIPDYAKSLGVDPEKTLDAMLTDLDIKQLRLVGYWDKMEPSPGKYDFSELDWQFAKANEHNAKVSLTLGLRQPRWPECHMPTWAAGEPMDIWSVQLKAFMKKVIERYKDNPALQNYQLENEFFLSVFGECPDFSRSRLVDEYNFVKDLDPGRKVLVSRSNNALGWPVGEPSPDVVGVSVYKRVWDITITKRYVEYPFPAWFYGFLGGIGKITSGKDLVIHELQAEPWTPDGLDIQNTPLAEQSKSLDAVRLRDRFGYAEGTGLRSIDLWGAEYWYYRKEILHDPSVWNVAKEEYLKAKVMNAEHFGIPLEHKN